MKKGILGILAAMGGMSVVGMLIGSKSKDRIAEIKAMSDKHLELFLMMNQWVKVKQDGKCLSTYFEEEGYKEIAIYGMSYAGETLAEELMGSNIIVKYGIDKHANSIYADFDIVTPDEHFDDVDAVVVTPITFFNEIEEMLSKRLSCPIISLEDILYHV